MRIRNEITFTLKVRLYFIGKFILCVFHMIQKDQRDNSGEAVFPSQDSSFVNDLVNQLDV